LSRKCRKKDISVDDNDSIVSSIPVESASATCSTPPAKSDPTSLEDRISKLYWDKNYITKMHLELTYRCNFRCVQCYNPTHSKLPNELSFEEWCQVLEDLAGMGCSTITLTGGELFVRRDAVDIIEKGADLGFSIVLNTNGSLIDDEIVASMSRFKPFIQAVAISFYGADHDTHDLICRKSGGYHRALRAVKVLKETNFPLYVKYITMRDNFSGIPIFSKTMKDLDVNYVISTGSIIPRTDRNPAPLLQLLTKDQFNSIAYSMNIKQGNDAKLCKPGHVRGAITPDGSVSPCEWLTDFQFGNLHNASLKDIWFSENASAFRKIFLEESECGSCKLNSKCCRCPAHSYLETGKLLSCAPIQRQNAQTLYDMHNIEPEMIF
jgi:MoaA/NifB/PqqE/SkfB family radical SAM enzyme